MPNNGDTKLKCFELINDALRLLGDVYHSNSITRRALLLMNVKMEWKEILNQVPMSEFLFGDDLEDKLKAAKILEKSSQDLKITKSKKPLNSKSLPRRVQNNRQGRQFTQTSRIPATKHRHNQNHQLNSSKHREVRRYKKHHN